MRRARPRYVTIARTDMGELARIDRWEGNDYIEQGWDGVADWALRNGEPLEPGDRDRDEVRYVSGDVNYWMALPFKLRDPGVHLAYQGRDAHDRHDVMVTFGQGVGSDVWHYYFEDDRTWPSRSPTRPGEPAASTTTAGRTCAPTRATPTSAPASTSGRAGCGRSCA